MPKKMTVAELAELMQRTMASKEDLAVLRTEMATKQDLAAAKEELQSDIRGLRADMNDEFADVRSALKYGPELDELRQRINRLEQKLGLK